MRDPSRRFGMSTCSAHAQCNHLPQHRDAVTDEVHLTAFSMIPAHRDFPQAQAATTGEEEQFDIEREPLDSRGFENSPTNVEAKRLKPALRVPDIETGREADKQVEHAASLLAAPRLMNTDQFSVERARPEG